MNPVVGAAAAWFVGRLRADVEKGVWSTVKGWVRGDPFDDQLEKITQVALEARVRSDLGGDHLDDEAVRAVVGVLDQLWPCTSVLEVGGETFRGRVRSLAESAIERAVKPVEGLGPESDGTSSLSQLVDDYGLVVEPEAFAERFTARWARALAAASVDGLAQLSNEVNTEGVRELQQEHHEEVLAKLAELLDLLSGQPDAGLDRSGRVASPVFPQFVGVPDRVPGFLGRADELEGLAGGLDGGGAMVVGQVAVGLGGVGKTAVVTELCHRQRAKVEVMRWLAADDRETLVAGYIGMGAGLGLDLTGLGLDDASARVRAWFETTDRSWLLVFDNVETPGVVKGLIPRQGSGRVVITSRFRDWVRPDVDVMRVGVLPPADAVALLAHWSGRPPDAEVEAAAALVAQLGWLALAVEQAGAFCRETGWSYTDYSEHLQTRSKELLARNPAALQHLQADGEGVTVLSVWDSSLERATAEAPRAGAALDVAAYLAPDNIPRGLLVGPVAADEELLGDGDALQVDEALATLARYSLIDAHSDPDSGQITGFSVHRLVQEITRLGHTTRNEPCDTAARLLRQAHPADPTQPDTWPLCRLLGPHVVAVAHHAETRHTSLATAAWLLDRYGTYLQFSGAPLLAPAQHERALQIARTDPDTDPRTLLTARNNLASAYQSAGRTDEAISHLEQVAATRVQLLGEDHPDTLTARNNLASAYQSAGRTDEAITLLERVLVDMDRVRGENHRDTLRARGNLANAYQSAGYTGKAIELYEQVLADSVRVRDEDHPDTLRTRGNLATLYWSVGRTGEAITLFERVRADSVRLLGENHPETLHVRANLAHTIQSAGRVGEALERLEHVRADCVRVLGENHPETLQIRANSAHSYLTAGRIGEAITLGEELLADCVRVLSEDHPLTLQVRNNLAGSYWKVGRAGEAIELLERVLADNVRVRGEDHPETLRVRGNIAGLFWSVGRTDEAITLNGQVLADRMRVLGEDHPDTLKTRQILDQWADSSENE